jgi:hypothetical protein
MRIPLNVQAELIVKLEAENAAADIEAAHLQSVIAKNAEGVTMLEPFAEWGEETTP